MYSHVQVINCVNFYYLIIIKKTILDGHTAFLLHYGFPHKHFFVSINSIFHLPFLLSSQHNDIILPFYFGLLCFF